MFIINNNNYIKGVINMNNFKKIGLTALAASLVSVSANAGSMSVFVGRRKCRNITLSVQLVQLSCILALWSCIWIDHGSPAGSLLGSIGNGFVHMIRWFWGTSRDARRITEILPNFLEIVGDCDAVCALIVDQSQCPSHAGQNPKDLCHLWCDNSWRI